MDAASRVLALPAEAQKRFQKAADESRWLRQQIDAQRSVIGEFAATPDKVDGLYKEIAATEEQHEAIDRQLSDAIAVLFDVVQSSSGKPPPVAPGPIVGSVIQMVQDALTKIAKSGIESGAPAVPISAVFDLESQINDIIDDLQAKGIFPETDDEAQQRVQEGQAHSERVLGFFQQALQTISEDD
jgi:hypothetical protein